MKSFTLAISAAALLAVSATHGPWSQYSCEKELLSYQLPSAWQGQTNTIWSRLATCLRLTRLIR